MLRFGTDGVRGVALTELTPEYVERLGAAAARVIGGDVWLIGRDTRVSGPVLEDALCAGLRSNGATVVRCEVVPTPALAHASLTRQLPAAMITASHNPFADNGVKIFAAGGRKLTDDVEDEIERLLEQGEVERADCHGGDTREPMVDEYVDHLVSLFPADALAGLTVVLDCANGAMSAAAPEAARRLGADVIVMNASPDGENINAGCGATHTAPLAAAVLAHGADAGLAFDGDGDRVIAVDDLGNVVDGDRLIALGALQLRDDGDLSSDTVVVTVMSNLGFHRAMSAHGISVVTTPVGDRYVLEALEQGGFAIGGEQSGHVIYRHLGTTGDGLLAGLKVLQRATASGRTLSDLASAVMTTYPQVLLNVRVSERHPDIVSELADEIAASERRLGDDGRVLVRASGTEPLIRVMVEASTDGRAQEIAEQLAAIVRARFAAPSG